jgi:hypothetical protein
VSAALSWKSANRTAKISFLCVSHQTIESGLPPRNFLRNRGTAL